MGWRRSNNDRWDDVLNARPAPDDATSRRLRELAEQWQREQADDRRR